MNNHTSNSTNICSSKPHVYRIITGQSAEELNGYIQAHLEEGWHIWGSPYGFSYVINCTVWEKHCQAIMYYFNERELIDPWKVLMKLVGDPNDGSHTHVSLFWDDATMTPTVVAGVQKSNQRTYLVERGSFEDIMLKIKGDLME